MKRWAVMVGVMLLGVGLLAQGPLTNLMNLQVRTDTNGYLMTSPGIYTGGDGPLTTFANLRGRTDANGYLLTTNTTSSGSFTTLTIITPGSGVVLTNGATNFLNVAGSISTTGGLNAAGANFIGFTGRGFLNSPADGQIVVGNSASTFGTLLKDDALPVASACGAGSPAAVAGSTPLSGSVTVGTGGPITCTITFGGTAYPSAPHCSGSVETTTAANARAMGYSASATVLTIVPSAAWVDSSVVNWTCMSSK